jgi:hypothetical protein
MRKPELDMSVLPTSVELPTQQFSNSSLLLKINLIILISLTQLKVCIFQLRKEYKIGTREPPTP